MLIVGSSAIDAKTIPFVTLLLLVINCCVFMKSYSLEIAAANDRPRFAFGEDFTFEESEADKELMNFFNLWGFQISDFGKGEVHSVLSNMFVHGGVMHLLGNMLALWAFAVAMEELFGSIGFIMLYISTGVVACVTQGLFMLTSDVPIVGASGAVAGVMGAFVVLLGFNASIKVWVGYIGMGIINIPSPVFAALWLFPQVLSIAEHGVVDGGGVALMAHLAGFAAGAVIALCCKPSFGSRINLQADGNLVIETKPRDLDQTEKQILDDILACRPYTEVVETLGDCQIYCPDCGSPLDLNNTVSDRLVRCTSGPCGKMVFIDGELLASHM